MRFSINQKQKSNFIIGLAITNCVIIISLLAQYIDCLQQQQQQQPQQQQSQQEQITALQQQQQQQLDQLVNNHSNEHATNTNNNNNNNNKPPRHQKVKSNHRLVSKLKDARHRRRHRHHRHRHYHSQTAASLAAAASGVAASAGSPAGSQQSPGNPFGSLIQEQPVAHTASSTALTALESIVEEVARAGAQIPLSAAAAVAASAIQQQHQREQVAPPVQPSSSVMSGPELLLDGGSSPVSSIQQQQQQQQQPALTAPNSSQAQPGNPNVASASSPSTQTTTTTTSTSTSLSGPAPTPHLTRGPLHNTRNLLLTSTLSKIYNLLNVTEFALEMRDGISSRASCVACNAVVGLFLSPLYSKEVFSAAIRTVCTSFKIQTARVCAGLVESFQDDFEYIRKNTKLTRDEVCGVVFGVDCARRQTYNLFWTVPIPEMPKNIAILNNQNANNINNQNENTNNNNNNNYDKQQDSPNGPQQPPITIPLSEHQMTNMEDAPDLFEYRKSNVVMAASASQTSASPQVVAMPAQSSSSQSSAQSTSSSSSSPSSASSPSLTTGGLPTGQKSQLKADNNGKQAAGEPSAPSPDNSNASGDLLLTPSNKQQASQQQQQHQVNNKKTKMLKRPQYIFDDDQLDNQHQHLQQDGQLQQQSQFNRQHRQQVSSFVHITDIHIDPYYEAGSLNECHEPLCCRATSGPVALNDKRRQAGRWGDYGNCDVPVRTLRNALERIREQHSDAEYWLWTGDISPHDIWNISKAESANHVRLVTKMVRQYSNGLPVFPVIGNHEAHPVNSFSPPEIKGKFSMSWLYDLLADEWSEWLPSDALKTLRMGGFYKLQVRKGFRIIALNTNYCARLNPWSFYDPVDPANQLKWLVEELLEAELNQDKVHIIGHVPPDNRECTQAWLFNFINIIDRFKDTIIAQFYGHTHRDEWRVVYSLAKHEEPIGIQYIGPSITPFTENNPSYRIYHQDKQGNILDSETYYFNLTEANETPTSEPNWRFSYSARAHLNMTQGLTAGQWHQYLQRLHDDDQLFDMFYKNFYRFSDVKTDSVCKNKCRFQMLSDLRLSHPYKTKPKPFLANRKTSNHHRDRHDHHHHHHKRLRHSE